VLYQHNSFWLRSSVCTVMDARSLQDLGRSPTFVVGSAQQQGTLDSLQRREQHFNESYQKNKPLCFSAKSFQRTHPKKAAQGYRDADAALVSPMLLGVADGVSQIEEFGIDASELPNELLNAVEELAVKQLLPDQISKAQSDAYRGPIAMMREAYEATESLGSTTILLAIMDNSTKIHGKLHPMIAIMSIGDCQILVLRRPRRGEPFEAVFETEMQRIGGHAQAPLQVARVDDSVDPDFREEIAIEVIERGSAVHCVSALEGDVTVMGSDGVFDNLFVDEIVQIVEEMMPRGYGKQFQPTDRNILGKIAKRIVAASHDKTMMSSGMYQDSPIGKGGKVDDTSCVVGEVIEWTDAHCDAWKSLRREKNWEKMFTCGGHLDPCREDESDAEELTMVGVGTGLRNYPSNPNGSFSTYYGSQVGSFSEYGGSEYGSFVSNYGGNSCVGASGGGAGSGSNGFGLDSKGQLLPPANWADRSRDHRTRVINDEEEWGANCCVM